MQLDQNPVFRKIIVPWYDSDTTCLLMIAFMLIVFFFGIAGLIVAQENPQYYGYIWVPFLLVLMSGWVILSTSVRLTKRYTRRASR